MATARVNNVQEHFAPSRSGASDPGAWARVGLRVELDLDNDRRRNDAAVLLFADHAGLETEWDAGVATTVLDSSIDTYLASVSAAEPLAAAQKSFIGSEITY